MSNPQRIQRKRTKGYRLPPLTVYVGRPTKFGNPFKVGDISPYGTVIVDKRHAAALFLGFAPQNLRLVEAAQAELRGMNLACWCPLDEPCHADTLLRIANAPIGETA